MTTFTSEDRASAERHTCEKCGRTLEIDAVHQCDKQAAWLKFVGESEARYQVDRKKRGIPDDGWRGD